MLRLLLCSSVLFFATIQAKLEDHFKPALGKEGFRTIKNVDFIYTINLDARPEKFQKCINQLRPYGIEPYRFSAVNGWEISLEEINDVALEYKPGMNGTMFGTSYLPENGGEPSHELISVYGKKYFCHCMSKGAIGIVLSHLSILQDAYDSGYQTIWVMEDDIEIIRNPHELSSLIEELDGFVGKEGWDILFTDRDTKGQNGQYVSCRSYAPRPNFSPRYPQRFAETIDFGTFIQVGARYGAYSMIVRRSGMKKILDFIKRHQVFLPYDMEFYLPEDMRLYSLAQDVVSTEPTAISDNGSPGYLEKIK